MSEWISVKCKTVTFDTCLVYVEYKACKEFDVGYMNDDGEWLSEDTHHIIPVTYWQPLPKPPKQWTS